MGKDTGPEPMDDSVQERANPMQATNNRRACYASKTLAVEVNEMFPETPVSYTNFDGRGAATDVTFDLTVHSGEDAKTITDLLSLISDPRVLRVVAEEGQVLVSMRPNPRIQDSREPFGLKDAHAILTEDVYTDGGDAGFTTSDEMDGGGA